MQYMLDTDTCIYIINQHPKMVRQAEPDDCAISVIVLGELERGKLRTDRADYVERFDRFIDGMHVVDLDRTAGEEYAAIRVHLESKGQVIGPNDLWIAAHARAVDVPLVTNNTREFSRVPGLTIDTWMT